MRDKRDIRDPEMECASLDEIRTLQGKKLVDLVERVYGKVPAYTKKMKEIGVEPGDIKNIEDIVKLPYTTKEDLRENYPLGMLAVPQEKIVRVQGSSGTTGKMTLSAYTDNDVKLWGECVARCFAMAGVTAEDRIHNGYGYGLFSGGMAFEFGARALGAMTIPMSIGNTARQIMCMEDLGATVLACTPSYALYLAETMAEMGVVDRMKLRVGIHAAEPWTEGMRKKLENTLHINCFDIYGLCEILAGIAQDCRYHSGLHVHHDHFYPEILRLEDQSPCAEGEVGELVLTTLSKEGMPLIRYRTKDLTSIQYGICECGRTLPKIAKIKGRTDDMKVIRGVNVFPTQVESALISVGEDVIPQYQMIVDRENNMDVLTVMVEVKHCYFAGEINRQDMLRKRIKERLRAVLGISPIVQLVAPKTIERSEGKAKHVIDRRNLH